MCGKKVKSRKKGGIRDGKDIGGILKGKPDGEDWRCGYGIGAEQLRGIGGDSGGKAEMEQCDHAGGEGRCTSDGRKYPKGIRQLQRRCGRHGREIQSDLHEAKQDGRE